MRTWAQVPEDRHQSLLVAPSLDEQIGRDHGIRVLDELLGEVDWSEWEAQYASERAGRPPIHPRLMVGAILYGLLKNVRSTRELEEATRMRLDFRWLLGGLSIDHTSFCVFRQRFEEQIGDLFKALNRRAAELKKATLEEVLIDGTRLRAHSDRHGARTAEALGRKLDRLEEQIQEGLRKLEQEELPEEGEESAATLRKRLDRLQAQQQQAQRALQVAEERDRNKRAKEGPSAPAVRVPVTDPEAMLSPNKEGGFAPNYTPVIAVDQASGLIVGAEVAEQNAESECVGDLLEQARCVGQKQPQRVLFDSGFASGSNLESLAEAQVEVFAPVGGADVRNPALREDPTEPVNEEDFQRLPMRAGRLDRTAFLYHQARDCYYCPMGQEMKKYRTQRRTQDAGGVLLVASYRCLSCSSCPLAERCLRGKSTQRTVTRDAYEPLREQVGVRMRTERGAAIYAHRAPGVEGAFAQIKGRLGVRRFNRRGLRKVRADWMWVCTAHNLMKLIRAHRKEAPSEPPSRSLSAGHGSWGLPSALRRTLGKFLDLRRHQPHFARSSLLIAPAA